MAQSKLCITDKAQVLHWNKARLLVEGGFVSGTSLCTGDESRDPSSPCLERRPQQLLFYPSHVHSDSKGPSTPEVEAKESKAGSLVKEIILTKDLDRN